MSNQNYCRQPKRTKEENFILLTREDYYCVVLYSANGDLVLRVPLNKLDLNPDDFVSYMLDNQLYIDTVSEVLTAVEALTKYPEQFFPWVVDKVDLTRYNKYTESDEKIKTKVIQAQQIIARKQAIQNLGLKTTSVQEMLEEATQDLKDVPDLEEENKPYLWRYYETFRTWV